MAVVLPPHAIHGRLEKSIDYTANAKKTTFRLSEFIDYTVNTEKTLEERFVSCLNCSSNENAAREMAEVKEMFGKEGGVLGYIMIQSFAPGEVTPDVAHEIGVRLAERYLNRYQVVIGTHLDKGHIHNHITFNSVSFYDGKKYLNMLKYLEEIRALSDDLCAEYGLSVLPKATTNRTLTHSEWRNKKDGTPSRNEILQHDIDAAIAASMSFQDFAANMQRMGYQVHYGQRVKYMTITPPGGGKARRVYRLGENYREEAIRERIYQNQQRQPIPEPRRGVRQYAQCRPPRPQVKLHGLRALYYSYLYKLRTIRQSPYSANRRTLYTLRSEIAKMNSYATQYRLLVENKISTLSELRAYKETVSHQVDLLIAQRNKITNQLRSNPSASSETILLAQRKALNEQLKPLRISCRACTEIEERSLHFVDMEARLQEQKKEQEQANRMQKEQDYQR